MARLVFGMNQSLDGYVDHMAFAPNPTLFRHFIEEAQAALKIVGALRAAGVAAEGQPVTESEKNFPVTPLAAAGPRLWEKR